MNTATGGRPEDLGLQCIQLHAVCLSSSTLRHHLCSRRYRSEVAVMQTVSKIHKSACRRRTDANKDRDPRSVTVGRGGGPTPVVRRTRLKRRLTSPVKFETIRLLLHVTRIHESQNKFALNCINLCKHNVDIDCIVLLKQFPKSSLLATRHCPLSGLTWKCRHAKQKPKIAV